MQKCARSVGVHQKKRAISAQNFHEVAPRVQCRRCRCGEMFVPTLAHLFCRFCAERARAARKTKCKNARVWPKRVRFWKRNLREVAPRVQQHRRRWQECLCRNSRIFSAAFCAERARISCIEKKCKNARVRLACTRKSVRFRGGVTPVIWMLTYLRAYIGANFVCTCNFCNFCTYVRRYNPPKKRYFHVTFVTVYGRTYELENLGISTSTE